MPLDGATLTKSPQNILQAAALLSGLRPIEPRVLDRHKAEQVRQHPPGWLYRNRILVQWMQMNLVMTAPVILAILLEFDFTTLGPALASMLFALAITPVLIPIKGRAEWKEELDNEFRHVPHSIRDKAFLLKQNVPEVKFYVGELLQDRVKLDPYLVAVFEREYLVLGIWDRDTVIAAA